MSGYVNDIKKTICSYDEDGWFKSGDVGYYTDDCCVFIVGRIKEMMIYKDRRVRWYSSYYFLKAKPCQSENIDFHSYLFLSDFIFEYPLHPAISILSLINFFLGVLLHFHLLILPSVMFIMKGQCLIKFPIHFMLLDLMMDINTLLSSTIWRIFSLLFLFRPHPVAFGNVFFWSWE